MERKEQGTCTCRIERERGERREDRGRKGLIEREEERGERYMYM